MKNILLKKFNQLIIRDFWMIKFWPYFHKSIWVAILFYFQKHFFESFRQNINLKNFVGFPSMTSKLKNDINYIKYKFSHKFEKVCTWLNMYYSNLWITTCKKNKNHVHLNHFKESYMDL
jgi:hypothetical protein